MLLTTAVDLTSTLPHQGNAAVVDSTIDTDDKDSSSNLLAN